MIGDIRMVDLQYTHGFKPRDEVEKVRKRRSGASIQR